MMLRTRISISRTVSACCFIRNKPRVQFCTAAVKSTSLHGFLKPHVESYEGETLNGKWHGKGTITYKNGGRFEGFFVNSKMEGRGIMITSQGKTLIGDYKDNKVWSGSGVAALSHSSFYEGEVVRGKYEGRGRFLKDGYKYEGEWKAGVYHGRGLEIHVDGSSYAGFYKDGKRHGMGIHVNNQRIMYRGQFENGMRHGKGSLVFPNGKTFEGVFAEGRIVSGKGYWELGEKGTAFEGEWVNGERAAGVITHFDKPSNPNNAPTPAGCTAPKYENWEGKGKSKSAGTGSSTAHTKEGISTSDAVHKQHGDNKDMGKQHRGPDKSKSHASLATTPKNNNKNNRNSTAHSPATTTTTPAISSTATTTDSAASIHNDKTNYTGKGVKHLKKHTDASTNRAERRQTTTPGAVDRDAKASAPPAVPDARTQAALTPWEKRYAVKSNASGSWPVEENQTSDLQSNKRRSK